ncbi:hypothetical protein GW17_00026126 [Ensete ventricosum]|nr:hypothetical protein GW17_00026126 [Ensete ventricosum]
MRNHVLWRVPSPLQPPTCIINLDRGCSTSKTSPPVIGEYYFSVMRSSSSPAVPFSIAEFMDILTRSLEFYPTSKNGQYTNNNPTKHCRNALRSFMLGGGIGSGLRLLLVGTKFCTTDEDSMCNFPQGDISSQESEYLLSQRTGNRW